MSNYDKTSAGFVIDPPETSTTLQAVIIRRPGFFARLVRAITYVFTGAA